jgi:hypothetical protein
MITDSKMIYGIRKGVFVGNGVLVGRIVGWITGAGVQVGGRRTSVGVGEGMNIVGTVVGGGNGLMDEFGLAKIAKTTIATISAQISTRMERISQIFNFIVFPPQTK